MEGVSLRSYALSRRKRGLPLQSHVGLKKAIERGALTEPAVVNGKIDPKLADEQLAEAHGVEAGMNGTPAHTDGRPLAAIRHSRESVRLQREELDLALKAGQLMHAESVRRVVSEAARRMRDRLLSVPARLAPLVPGITDEREAYAALEKEMHDALAEFTRLDLNDAGRAS